MQGSKVVKTFGINQADISAYTASVAATWVSIPIVGSGTLELTVQEEDVRDGEGFLDTIWYHSLDASVSVVAKTWIMRVLELITGNSVSSYSGTGAEAIHFGEASAITPPSVRLRMKVQAKDHNSSDATTYAWVYIFKATASFPSFSMEEVTPNSMELNFRGLRVTDDDAGATIAKAYGRLELGSSS